MNGRGRLWILVAAMLGTWGSALADGMIVPVRPDLPVRGSWSVKHHHVKLTVRDQVASVHIDQAFVNNGSRPLEVEYLFPIPPEAAIDAMTLVVDGKEMAGKILPAEEARRIYENIVRQKKDPALLEYVGFGLYRTRAFPLEPGKPAHVVVHYNQVCRKDYDLVQVFYPLNTEKFSARKIDSVEVAVDIKEKADITAVYSPTHDLDVKRQDPRHVIATYKVKDAVPATDFIVYYKAADEKVGATVLSHRSDKTKDGYFMVLVSPNPRAAAKAVASKDIVIVLDHSGSMSQDRKMDQAREALRFVLSSLGDEDRFNVVTFSGSAEAFFKKLVDATKKNRSEAVDLLDRVEATGGTNIGEALTTALGMFEGDRPAYVLFITDGLPTVGERKEEAIREMARKANAAKVRLFALGVGYDVNVRLIDNLVRENRGLSDYVKPAEPLEAKISNLYNKIKRPVMTDLAFDFGDVRTSATYPRELPDLFDGGQIVLVGRYHDGGKTNLKITGRLEGARQTFTYKAALDSVSENNKNEFVERLWAVRRVGHLLDQIQLYGKSQEVVDELVKLSRDYGILTPYTAFLADETVAVHKPKELGAAMQKEALRLAEDSGGAAGQMAAKSRGSLNEAARAPAPASTVPGGGRGSTYYGHGDAKKYEAGEKEQTQSVATVGGQTLYRRGNRWVTVDTAGLDPEKDADKITEIKRFSEEYFSLVRKNTVAENQILASQAADEELIIRLRGTVYRVR